MLDFLKKPPELGVIAGYRFWMAQEVGDVTLPAVICGRCGGHYLSLERVRRNAYIAHCWEDCTLKASGEDPTIRLMLEHLRAEARNPAIKPPH